MKATIAMAATLVKPAGGVAVIFGGSRGIGAACSRLFVENGWTTVAVSRNEENLQKIQSAMSPERLQCRVCDVSREAEVGKTVKDIEDTVGPIHVVVNSAGITKNKLLVQCSPEEMLSVMETNLMGTMFTSRAALRYMLRRKTGSIVNIGSIVGSHGNPGQTVYAASKSGLVGFTKALAKEVASRNIRVNMVSPGLIETDMTSGIDMSSSLVSQIALRRFGDASEVARVVYFVATGATYVTGQELQVCGGLSMRMV